MILPYIFTALLTAVALILQGADIIAIAGKKPDLVFIIVVYIGYSFGSFNGQLAGFIGGLFHDSISRSPLGLLTLPKVVLGFMAGMIGRGVVKNTVIAIMLLLFVASLLKGILTLFLAYIFHQALLVSVIQVIIPEALYNAVIAPPLFFIFDRIFHGELERGGFL
ncbi:MAG TPA: rod shape-determining protein MreD [Spirochaetota bacterium]|nr:rod shape-determining protein MreD [Spirochaetota bacterium]HQO41314.1 rod shape-determining protein MreD [Spirochaetota bacterium]